MNADTKRKLVWGFVIALGIAHYDFWYWDDTSVVLGFMPVGLFFHASISLLAGIAWALVVKHAWPSWIEDWAAQDEVSIRSISEETSEETGEETGAEAAQERDDA